MQSEWQPEWREYFDRNVEAVIQELPEEIRDLLETTPLVVEDRPSRRMLRDLQMDSSEFLCGLYSGIPITERSVESSGVLSDVVYLFREGICNLALDNAGQISDQSLREQIRITILHELGHQHGLSEEDLDELGYG